MNTTSQAHEMQGVGDETRVSCPESGSEHGPHETAESGMTFCPYCGVEVQTEENHREHEDGNEVFCPETIMSTWRYCPKCGDKIDRGWS